MPSNQFLAKLPGPSGGILHHLTPEEFREARDDIAEGYYSFFSVYMGYIKLYRGLIKLAVPQDDIPAATVRLMETGLGYIKLMELSRALEAVKASENPDELMAKAKELGELTESFFRTGAGEGT